MILVPGDFFVLNHKLGPAVKPALWSSFVPSPIADSIVVSSKSLSVLQKKVGWLQWWVKYECRTDEDLKNFLLLGVMSSEEIHSALGRCGAGPGLLAGRAPDKGCIQNSMKKGVVARAAGITPSTPFPGGSAPRPT